MRLETERLVLATERADVDQPNASTLRVPRKPGLMQTVHRLAAGRPIPDFGLRRIHTVG